MIDPSGGNEFEFDLNFSSEFYQRFKEKLPSIVVGFAGGLNGENVCFRVNSLKRKLGTLDFSIDAEGGLRDKLSPAYGDDLLKLTKVSSYISKVLRF